MLLGTNEADEFGTSLLRLALCSATKPILLSFGMASSDICAPHQIIFRLVFMITIVAMQRA
jgi:hypothetical protein